VRGSIECAREVVGRKVVRHPIVSVSTIVEVGSVQVHTSMDFALAKS